VRTEIVERLSGKVTGTLTLDEHGVAVADEGARWIIESNGVFVCVAQTQKPTLAGLRVILRRAGIVFRPLHREDVRRDLPAAFPIELRPIRRPVLSAST
jgi:hypothetical protein